MNNKRGHGVILEGKTRNIIYNLYRAFEQEKIRASELHRKLINTRIQKWPCQSNEIDGVTISQKLFDELSEFLKGSMKACERVVKTTGVSKNTVTRIKKEGEAAAAAGTYEIGTPVKKPRGKIVVLNDKELYALSIIITNLHKTENAVPSLTKILASARSELNFKWGMTSLRKILKAQLGYKFTRGNDNSRQITMVIPKVSDKSSEDITPNNLKTEIMDTQTETRHIVTDNLKKEIMDTENESELKETDYLKTEIVVTQTEAIDIATDYLKKEIMDH